MLCIQIEYIYTCTSCSPPESAISTFCKKETHNYNILSECHIHRQAGSGGACSPRNKQLMSCMQRTATSRQIYLQLLSLSIMRALFMANDSKISVISLYFTSHFELTRCHFYLKFHSYFQSIQVLHACMADC